MKFSILTGLMPLLAAGLSISDRAALPPAFFLAGDSTVASGGGWGNAFISFLRAGGKGQNLGHNGRTTASFVSGGDWAKVLALVTSNKASYDVYVPIQFGHNDQKSGSGVTIAQFQTNLINMAKAVTSAGGTPIIITSLTRRSFSNGVLSDSLADVTAAAKAAATSVGATLLDLNLVSKTFVQAIGTTNADKYNLASGDRTHLNAWGGVVFGRMVADLLVAKKSALSTYITPNATMTTLIAKGVYV